MQRAAARAVCVAWGLVLGDVLAATFHWYEDNYLDVRTRLPVLAGVARDNEFHHFFPRAIVFWSFWENIANSALLALALFGLYRLSGLAWDWVAVPALLAAGLANGFHKWSHLRDCEVNPLLGLLRRRGVLCGHDYHARHHADTSTRYNVIFPFTECITNPLHALLERAAALLGARPDRIRSHLDQPDRWTRSQWESHISPCPAPLAESDVRDAEAAAGT